MCVSYVNLFSVYVLPWMHNFILHGKDNIINFKINEAQYEFSKNENVYVYKAKPSSHLL